MTLTESRSTHSWQEAIAIGPHLVTLAEALPSHESTGLVMQLASLMVEIPATITADLVRGGEQRFNPIFRLSAALELIERVYPALDGASVRTALDHLADRVASDHFADRVAPPAVAAAEHDEFEPSPPATPETVSITPTQMPEETIVHVQPDSSE